MCAQTPSKLERLKKIILGKIILGRTGKIILTRKKNFLGNWGRTGTDTGAKKQRMKVWQKK